MPRYYFDIRDGDDVAIDEEGLDLPAIEAAETEAARSLADIAAELRRQKAECQRLTIEVRAGDAPLFKATLAFEAARTLH